MNTPAPFPAASLSSGLLASLVTIQDGRGGPFLIPLPELTRTDAPARSRGIPSVGASWAFAGRGRRLDPFVAVDGRPDGPAVIPLVELTRTR